MFAALIRRILESRLLVLLLAALLMAAGWVSYTGLPVDAFPDVSPNLVQVFTDTEGLAPEEIEDYVTYPVEAAMNGLPGVAEIRSISNFGLSVVNVYFATTWTSTSPVRWSANGCRRRGSRFRRALAIRNWGRFRPGWARSSSTTSKTRPGSYSLEELRTIQDWLVKFHLQTVPGVTEVLGIGGCEKQFQVEVHPERPAPLRRVPGRRDRRGSARTTSTSAPSSSSATPRS